jgi:hypothetical protein
VSTKTVTPIPPHLALKTPRVVGKCYVFFRKGHDWNTCEVAVLRRHRGDTYTVARASDVAEGLLAPRGSKKRKLITWPVKHEELW